MRVYIRLPCIVAKRPETLFPDVTQADRVHPQADDLSLIGLEKLGRRLHHQDNWNVGDEVAAHRQIDRKRSLRCTRNSDNDDLSAVQIFQSHPVVMLNYEGQRIHAAVIILVEAIDTARHAAGSRTYK